MPASRFSGPAGQSFLIGQTRKQRCHTTRRPTVMSSSDSSPETGTSRPRVSRYLFCASTRRAPENPHWTAHSRSGYAESSRRRVWYPAAIVFQEWQHQSASPGLRPVPSYQPCIRSIGRPREATDTLEPLQRRGPRLPVVRASAGRWPPQEPRRGYSRRQYCRRFQRWLGVARGGPGFRYIGV